MRNPSGESSGFTLIELMLGIVILAILLAIAVPSFTNIAGKNRLKAAAERFSTELQMARSEAIAQNRTLLVHMQPGTDWCIGLDDTGSDCDCANSPSQCTVDGELRVVTAGDFENVTVQASSLSDDDVIFDNVRGLPDGGGNVTFENEDGKRVEVRMSLLGSVNLCSPTGTANIGDYQDCP